MKKVTISNKEEQDEKNLSDFELSQPQTPKSLKCSFNIKHFVVVFFILNAIIDCYLIIENHQNKNKIDVLMKLYNKISENNQENKSNTNRNELKNQDLTYKKNANSILNESLKIDRDMIGLVYPEIKFQELQKDLENNEIIPLIQKFLYQLETKLIYLEKEINVTKLVSFYHARKLYLDRNHVYYNDGDVRQIHEIISWTVIHKSTQLKGIASDKYLVCKYTESKLGENLCGQRLISYDSVEEMNFKKIKEFGSVVIKISNGCGDKIFIYENQKIDIESTKELIQKNFERDYGIDNGEFFHLYSKKRIIIEKMFYPLKDLFEFKFYVVNNKVKLIYLTFLDNNQTRFAYYHPNYKFYRKKKERNAFFDLSQFDRELLDKLKYYAIKLSDDFPNFIRVDLYLFHNQIYLSELTFDSHNGRPFIFYLHNVKQAGRDWKKVDY